MLASSFEAPRTNTVRLFAVPMRLLAYFRSVEWLLGSGRLS
jgi:hypothetical protein